MQELKDNFSKQSAEYKKYRPTYPAELYKEILRLCPGRSECWDCGTGNGQAAAVLSTFFDKVQATDISAQQLKNAVKKDNIIYSVARASKTDFKDEQFDLITVAQAVHWFDQQNYCKEFRRVLKKDGLVAIWGYQLPKFSKEIDAMLDDFYENVVGKYWDIERKHVDMGLKTICFDFDEVEEKKDFFIKKCYSFSDMIGFLSSWSSVQHYITKNNQDPVQEFAIKLKSVWKENETYIGKFPIVYRFGRKKKD